MTFRTLLPEQLAQTFHRHLIDALMLQGGDTLQSIRKIVWNLNRHLQPQAIVSNIHGRKRCCDSELGVAAR